MDTRTRSHSPSAANDDHATEHAQTPPLQDKISAYYSLVFPHFTFYIQTLSITIGRRCSPNPNAATSSTAEQHTVDVDLGALKSVSRLHAKIEYDQEEDRFVLVVIGRNGAWVDGVWSGAGTRAPLGERSQIQIASRTFHFVLPPPPAPEDTPSPSSQSAQSSAHRARSPSVDITSISPPSSQPSHSPILDVKPLPPTPEPPVRPLPKIEPPPELPNSNSIGKSNKANAKKRKKGEVEPPPPIIRPKPEDMPPKPPFTYAQLIYRAIKDIGGKATLQEICTWIMNTHEYYRYADGAWMSSVRHNLSSGRAFLKMERCGGDRGKGFFWSVDEKYAQALGEQESKAQAAAQAAASGSKDVAAIKPNRKKDKSALLEPPLRRSIKGDLKGTPLPPPLTSAPLAFKTALTSTSTSQPTTTPPTVTNSAATGVFPYPSAQQATDSKPSQQTQYATSSTVSSVNPYTPLTHWNLHPSASGTPPAPTAMASPPLSVPSVPPKPVPVQAPGEGPSPQALPSNPPPTAALSQSAPAQGVVPDVVIPIVLGVIPPSHPDYTPGQPNNSAKEGYMVLHERTLILDPNVFSGLTKERLLEIERMGARAALAVLTQHMVKALKERRAKGRNKDRANRKPKAKKSPPTAPFTNTPLTNRGGPVPGTSAVESATPTPGLSGSATPAPNHPPPPPPSAYGTTQPFGIPPPNGGDPGMADPGSPLIIVDDSEDEGPAMKRRKLDTGSPPALAIAT
ncbi:hypothetical protein D9611_007661 [Ephemerocybe angulata]|uniref:Uncharacterized protein n=1 Tax=Ephemerocybe angulata TaxID=980116 RepID=A0A8H5BY94_9AGAR|nr:hypothetical protein D9611_007661 [Tulosesus angulatus]